MDETNNTNVEANSREFTRGAEAGLKSEDTKYRQAGYELGQGLSDKDAKEPVKEILQEESDTHYSSKILWTVTRVTPSYEKNKSAE